MDDSPLFYLLEKFLLKKGVLLLLLVFLSVKPIIGQTSPPLPFEVTPYPDNPSLTDRIERSQRILKALFFEQRYQYVEARKIWETLPRSSGSVGDHIFQSELLEMKSLDIGSVPVTVFSIKVAASYLKWRKQWSKAYQLLLEQSALVAQNEDLQFIQVMLALYLRKYEDAQKQLRKMDSANVHDKMQLGLLWSWYYMLSERLDKLMMELEELEDNAFYYPASFVISESARYPWQETKENALRALTRFPSDRELIERIVTLFRQQEDYDELDSILDYQQYSSDVPTAWMIWADVYLQTRQFEKLKRLLRDIQPAEKHRIEFFNYLAQIAIFEREWKQLMGIAEQCRIQFPFLRDGDLFMAIYEQHMSPPMN